MSTALSDWKPASVFIELKTILHRIVSGLFSVDIKEAMAPRHLTFNYINETIQTARILLLVKFNNFLFIISKYMQNIMQDQEQLQKFEMFLKAKNPRTAAAYMRDVDRLLKFTGKKIEEINNLDISNFFNHMRELGHNERSILRYGAALKKFFKLCNRPMIALYIETPTYQVPPPTWLPADKIFKLVSKADPFQAKVIFAVSYDLALRIGEIKLLKKKWYNPENRQIKVFREKSRGAPNEYILELSEETNELLKEYLEKNNDKGACIFPVSTELVTYYYRRTATLIGVDYHTYTFHSIRHSSITHKAIQMLKESGQVDLARLAKFAGHLRMETTLLYIHLASEYLAFKKE